MQSEMSRGGTTTQLAGDSRCTTCTQGASGDLLLNSSYPLGPAAEIGDGGFHGANFSSFHTYVLLHDSDDSERQVSTTPPPLVDDGSRLPSSAHRDGTRRAALLRAPDRLAVDCSRSLRRHTGAAVLQGLAVRKMYRILAPQVTENPVFMHLTDTTPKGVRKAVDQCAEVGLCAAHTRLPPSDPSASRVPELVVDSRPLI